MTPTRRSPMWGSLLLGIAALFLSGCKNEAHVSLSEDKKIVLNPNYKDKIQWAGVQVHFLLPGLCEEKDKWISTCSVKIKTAPGEFGKYNYICKNGMCKDPEVDVGSSTGNPNPLSKYTLSQASFAAAALQPDVEVVLPCDAGSHMIMPMPADVPGDLYGPIQSGTVLQWESNGTGSVLLADWRVTFDAGNATVCKETDIHNETGYRACTIKDGLTPGSYRYTAASGRCQSGSGSVTVTARQ